MEALLHDHIMVDSIAGKGQTLEVEVNVLLVHNISVKSDCFYHCSHVHVAGPRKLNYGLRTQ